MHLISSVPSLMRAHSIYTQQAQAAAARGQALHGSDREWEIAAKLDKETSDPKYEEGLFVVACI